MKPIVAAVLGLVVVAGCGNDNGSPGAPTPPAPAATQIALSGTRDQMFIGQTHVFVATGTFSDGASRVVAGNWSSDAPSVASVSAAGQVQALAAGEATITVTFDGRVATQRVRVLPDYAGRWQDAWREIGCDETLDWRGGCGEIDSTSLWRITFDLTQDRDSVTGQLSPYTDATFPTAGRVAVDGALSQRGSISFEESIGIVDLEIVDWLSRSTDNQTMTGGFKVRYTARKYQGEMVITMELVGADKIGIVPARAGGAVSARPTWTGRLPR